MKLSPRILILLAVLTFLLLISRVMAILPTLDPSFMDTYRAGIMPVNDGADWLERSLFILEGVKINMRPMFPVFMADFIFFSGINLPYLVALFVTINIVSIIIAFMLLKDSRNPALSAVLLTFFCVWRAVFPASVMTETLAAPILLVAFCLILKGLETKAFRYMVLGYFLTGLAQAIRPWDFMSMATLPLLPLFYMGLKKESFKLVGILILAIGLGFGMDAISGRIFSTSGQANIDKAHHLFGQLSGGLGNNYWIADPEIRPAMIENARGDMSSEEVVKLINQKAFKVLAEKPHLVFKGMFRSFMMYLRQLHVGFSGNLLTSAYFPVFVLFFAFMFFGPLFLKRFISAIPAWKIVFAALACLLFLKNSQAFFNWFAFIGVAFIFIYPDRRVISFIGLYIAGIVLSFMVVGTTGSGRMWISQELLSYFICSTGIAAVFSRYKTPFGDDPSGKFSISTRTCLRYLAAAFILSLVIFVLLPEGLRSTGKFRSVDIKTPVTPEYIADSLGIKDSIVSQETLTANILMWPQPTFETLNGRIGYWKTRYRSFKAYELEAGKGITDPKWMLSKWHLMPFPFRRVAYDDRNPMIFPGATKADLEQFDAKEIIAVGRIIGRPRRFFTHQGFMILVEYIGYPDKNGQLQWIKMDSVAK